MKRIPYTTQEEWHAIRAKHIGGSEIASLFNTFRVPDGTTDSGARLSYHHLFEDIPDNWELIGSVSPYCSGVRLWHEKKGNMEPKSFDKNAVATAGRYFESGIAEWARDKYKDKNIYPDYPDLDIRKVDDYIEHPTIPGMGASLDYEIPNHPSGHTAMDCKLLRAEIWRDEWKDTGEPPLHIILQLHHQMACTGMQHGVVAARVDSGDLHLVDVPRNENSITKCEAAVAAFWESQKTGKEPDIKYDVTVARDLYHTSDEEIVLDFSDNTVASNFDFQSLVNTWKLGKAQERRWKSGNEAAAHEIFSIVKDANKVLLSDGRVLYAKTCKKKGYTNEVIPTTYRKLTVKEAT